MPYQVPVGGAGGPLGPWTYLGGPGRAVGPLGGPLWALVGIKAQKSPR